MLLAGHFRTFGNLETGALALQVKLFCSIPASLDVCSGGLHVHEGSDVLGVSDTSIRSTLLGSLSGNPSWGSFLRPPPQFRKPPYVSDKDSLSACQCLRHLRGQSKCGFPALSSRPHALELMTCGLIFSCKQRERYLTLKVAWYTYVHLSSAS